MSSSYTPQVGDIVIPSRGQFEGLKCRVVFIADVLDVGVECLEKKDAGHNLDGRLSTPNGWWYPVSVLNYKGKDNSTNSTNSKFKVGDEVVSNLYPERGPGIIVSIPNPFSVAVKHHYSFPEGHDCDNTVPHGQGWWYNDDLLSKVTTAFKVGDRVSSPLYSERGPGTVRESDCKTLILVEHDDIFENGHDGDGDCFPGTSWFYNESEIQIVHEVKPKPEPEPELKPEFKVGDVVETKLNSIRGPGVILKIQPSGAYAVEHFKHIQTHSCMGLGKNGHCWNYEKNEIILSSATKPVEPVSLTSTGIEVTGITGITGITKGITGPIISSSADPSILADFDEYLKTSYIHDADSGGWIGMSGTTAGSKKPKPSVDKYIQDPIISKKTKKKKSLVIV